MLAAALSAGELTAIAIAVLYFLLGLVLLSVLLAAKHGDLLLREARMRDCLAAGERARASRSRRANAHLRPPAPLPTLREAEPRPVQPPTAPSLTVDGSPSVGFNLDEWNARYYGRAR